MFQVTNEAAHLRKLKAQFLCGMEQFLSKTAGWVSYGLRGCFLDGLSAR